MMRKFSFAEIGYWLSLLSLLMIPVLAFRQGTVAFATRGVSKNGH
jgi:hypothetical protein